MLHNVHDVRTGVVSYKQWQDEISALADLELAEWCKRNAIDRKCIRRHAYPKFYNPQVIDVVDWEWKSFSALTFVEFEENGRKYRWFHPGAPSEFQGGLDALPAGYEQFYEKPKHSCEELQHAREKTSFSHRESVTLEPTIDEAKYQHILKVMGDMALMMERSPRTFAKLQEEEIRDHFLLQLNGHYEGSATGETFNAAGKTDILVREGNRNLFIGECKNWQGSQKLLDAINQVLNYLTWRDTKSAIMIFSRNKNFTSVLETIRSTVEKHPHKKRGPEVESETCFRYVFGNQNDHSREIVVTIMAFSVL